MNLWTLSLIVEVDEDRALLTPHVRIDGGTPFGHATVRALLIDADGGCNGMVRGSLPSAALGTYVELPSVTVPPDARIDEAIRWGWEVIVRTDGRDRIRWRRYLEVGTVIGVDGEIRLAGPRDDLRSKAEDEGWGPEAPWDDRDSDRFLWTLVVDGIISEADRKAVLAEAAYSGRTVERILVHRGHLGERDMLGRYAAVTGDELLDLEEYPVDPDAAARIPEEVVRHFGLLAVGYRCDMLAVAMSDPQNVRAIRAVELIDHPYRPYFALATRADILRAFDRVSAD